MSKKKFEPRIKNDEVLDGAEVGRGAIVRGSGFVFDRVLQQKIRHRAELIHAFCIKYYEDVKYWTFGTNREEWDAGCAKAVHYFCKWLTDNGHEWIICLEQGTKSNHVHGHLILRTHLDFHEAQSVWVSYLCYYAYRGKRFYVTDKEGVKHLFDGSKVPTLRGRGKKIDSGILPAGYFRENPGSLGYVRFYHLKYKCKSSEHLASYLVKCCGLADYFNKNSKKKDADSSNLEDVIYTHRSSNFLRQSLAGTIEQIRNERLKRTCQKYVYIRMRKRSFLASVYCHGWARQGLSDEQKTACDQAFDDEVKRLGLTSEALASYPAYSVEWIQNTLPYMEADEVPKTCEADVPIPYMEHKNY